MSVSVSTTRRMIARGSAHEIAEELSRDLAAEGFAERKVTAVAEYVARMMDLFEWKRAAVHVVVGKDAEDITLAVFSI